MKKLSLYYVAEVATDRYYTAGVLRKDNEKILEEQGFFSLKFRTYKSNSWIVKLLRVCDCLQVSLLINKNSMVAFHFPLYANAYKWFLLFLNWRQVKTIAIVVDIDGIRDKNELLLEKELHLLQQFTYIVAHNLAMKNVLLNRLPNAKIFPIDLFDYPFKGQQSKLRLSSTICFAGNISKSNFVYKLPNSELKLNIYGPGFDQTLNIIPNLIYKGVFLPEHLPAKLEGSFGLVWDGDDIEICDDYLRYNNPHKLSLYIVTGMPVIVWTKSAVATFVKENNIGFTINSLKELPEKLSTISSTEYELMRLAILRFAEQASQGLFLKQVLNKIYGSHL